MVSLWKTIRRRKHGIPHHYIQLSDVTDITYAMVTLYYKAWGEIVDLFNHAKCPTPVSDKPIGKEGLHIYLKHCAEFHVYPLDRNYIYVVFVEDETKITYKAECEPLYMWFAKRSSHAAGLNQEKESSTYLGETGKRHVDTV